MKNNMLIRTTLLGAITVLMAVSHTHARDAAPGFVEDFWAKNPNMVVQQVDRHPMPTLAVPRGTFVGKGFPASLDNYFFRGPNQGADF
ncbi:MAG: hypothetical protein PVG22_04135 [Chromatiales bacterium]